MWHRGMFDRYAYVAAVEPLGWPLELLPPTAWLSPNRMGTAHGRAPSQDRQGPAVVIGPSEDSGSYPAWMSARITT